MDEFFFTWKEIFFVGVKTNWHLFICEQLKSKNEERKTELFGPWQTEEYKPPHAVNVGFISQLFKGGFHQPTPVLTLIGDYLLNVLWKSHN